MPGEKDEVLEEKWISVEFPELSNSNLDEMLQSLRIEDPTSANPQVELNDFFKFRSYLTNANATDVFFKISEFQRSADKDNSPTKTTHIQTVATTTETLCCEIQTLQQQNTMLLAPDSI